METCGKHPYKVHVLGLYSGYNNHLLCYCSQQGRLWTCVSETKVKTSHFITLKVLMKRKIRYSDYGFIEKSLSTEQLLQFVPIYRNLRNIELCLISKLNNNAYLYSDVTLRIITVARTKTLFETLEKVACNVLCSKNS